MSAPEQVGYTDDEVSEHLTCHHEAGHVSLCFLFEIPFDYVRLVTGFWGRTASGYVQTPDDADPEKLDGEITMMYAGLAAEEVWLERHPGHGRVNPGNGEGDTRMAAELIRDYDTSDEGWLRRRALHLVEQRWEDIEKIAAELLVRRRLTAAAARRAGR